MKRTVLLAVSTAAIAALALPAVAAPPKPITKEFTYTDGTPDATATAASGVGCDGVLPNEPGIEFTAPAAGKLKVSITHTGDWALEVHDPKGRVLGAADGGGPNDQESVTVKLKTAGTYTILPCNIGALPEAKGKIEYKP